MVRGSLPRLLTRLPDPPDKEEVDGGEELDESEVVWSSFADEIQPLTPTTTSTVTAAAYSLSSLHPFSSSPSAGLSAALFSPDSPKSVQRKTTSSPVAMISTRSSDGAGPYYGRKFQFHQSAPVNVPVWPGPRRGSYGFDDGDDEGFHDDGEMVPPHEIVARSHKTTTFSVVEGAGRTLKGRDLTRVRNDVFQKTGFLQ